MFTYLSNYCEFVYFLSALSKFFGASIWILLSWFDNFFCLGSIDIPVVDSHCSYSTDLACCSPYLLFHSWSILLNDEVLLDPLSLELSDLVLLALFPSVYCLCWLFLFSFVSLSPKSLSPSCCYDKVSYSAVDSVVNIVLVDVLSALPLHLPLPFICRVCKLLLILCWTRFNKSPPACTFLSYCVPHVVNTIMSSYFWSTQCSSLWIETDSFFNTLLMFAFNSNSFSCNRYSNCHKKCFVAVFNSNLISLAWNFWAISNCCVHVMISSISSFTDF